MLMRRRGQADSYTLLEGLQIIYPPKSKQPHDMTILRWVYTAYTLQRHIHIYYIFIYIYKSQAMGIRWGVYQQMNRGRICADV